MIGIDLGNLSAKIAVIAFRDGNKSTVVDAIDIPSCVSLARTNRFIGTSAKQFRKFNYRNSVGCLKRLIGRSISEATLSLLEQKFMSIPLVDAGDGTVGIKACFQYAERLYSATHLVAMLFGHIRDTAASTSTLVSQDFRDTVIAVPLWYTDRQRQSVLDAAFIADLHPLSVMDDIIAVALAYYTEIYLPVRSDVRAIVFVDIGQSDFSVVFVTFSKGKMVIWSVGSDSHFGGRDIDLCLIHHFSSQLQNQTGIDILSDPKLSSTLASECKTLKIKLSSVEEACFKSNTVVMNTNIEFNVGHRELGSILSNLLERIPNLLRSAFNESTLKLDEIDAVELVGGSTLIPCVRESISTFFGTRIPILGSLQHQKAVARGAAYAGALLLKFPLFDPAMLDCNKSCPVEIVLPESPTWIKEGPGIKKTGRQNPLNYPILMPLKEFETYMNRLLAETAVFRQKLVALTSIISNNIDAPGFGLNDRLELSHTIQATTDWLLSSGPCDMTRLAFEERLRKLQNLHDRLLPIFQEAPKLSDAVDALQDQIAKSRNSTIWLDVEDRKGLVEMCDETSQWLRELPNVPLTPTFRVGDVVARREQISNFTANVVEKRSQFLAQIIKSSPENPSTQQHLQQRLSSVPDPTEQIKILQAMALLIPCHSDEMSQLLDKLGALFTSRFSAHRNACDTEDAILARTRAIEITQDDQTRIIYLTNLGNSLLFFFDCLGDLVYGRKAVSAFEKAEDLTLPSDANKAMRLSSLGKAHLKCFERSGCVEDCDKAISVYKKAIDPEFTPEDAPDQLTHLRNLGDAYKARFKHSMDSRDADEGTFYYSRATRLATAAPAERLKTCLEWVAIAPRSPRFCDTLLEAHENALSLLPRIAWLGDTIDRRRQELAKVPNAIVSSGVAEAIRMNRFELALELWEFGRSILLRQELRLETPQYALLCLMGGSYSLGSRICQLSMDFHSHVKITSATSLHQAVQHRRKLAKEWESTLSEVRQLPLHRRYMLPQKFSTLASVAALGHICVLNATPIRCDALIIRHSATSCSSLLHIQLPIEYAKLQELAMQVTSLLRANGREWRKDDRHGGIRMVVGVRTSWVEILRILWNSVVNPVLQTLQLEPSDDPPRLWWCASGLLVGLPLHAAGLYGQDKTVSISDFVISSYTPSLELLYRDLNRSPSEESFRKGHEKAIVVGISKTPHSGAAPLPNVKLELDNIFAIVPKTSLTSFLDERATCKDVIEAIRLCSFLHLACHAKQDISPLNSGFLLYNGFLKLSNLIHMGFPYADFAFLSACQTAKGDILMPDESLHLAGGMLYAGFNSVIASMWSIDDSDGPVVAAAVYKELFRKGRLVSSYSAKALHHAVRNLRQTGVGFERWVPFIHLGR